MNDIASYKKAILRRLLRGTLALGIGLTLFYFSGVTFSGPFVNDYMPEAKEPMTDAWSLLYVVGLPFVTYGIVVCLNAAFDWIVLSRSTAALRKKFPERDIRDIPCLAEFAIEEIGAYVFEDHLFLVSDEVFYMEDLRRVEWLFTTPGPGQWIQSLVLVISRDDKTRIYVLVPYSTETFFSPSQLWLQSKPNIDRLLDRLKEKYPHIQFGHAKEQEKNWLSGQPLWKKIFEMARYN